MCTQVFGLDSLTGAVVWQYLLPNMKPFQRKSVTGGDVYMQSVMPLFVQRTTAHFPHQPVCTVVGADTVRNVTSHCCVFLSVFIKLTLMTLREMFGCVFDVILVC